MVEGEDKNKKDESKGFAGLSSLVSDVDTSPPPTAKKEPTNTLGASSSTATPASPAAQPQPQPRQQQTHQEAPQPSSGSSGGKWVLGIAAVIGVLWLIGQSNKTTTSPASTYSPPAQSTAPGDSSPTQQQVPSRPAESQPPVGQNIVLSIDQIRYCLAEDIRMDGARTVLNNYNDADVDRFNAMVADYNSRCGSFRYRSGSLQRARRAVEPHRSDFMAEGRTKFGGARPSTTTQPTQPPQPTRAAITSSPEGKPISNQGYPRQASALSNETHCPAGTHWISTKGECCQEFSSIPSGKNSFRLDWTGCSAPVKASGPSVRSSTTAKTTGCVYKPVMNDEDLRACGAESK